MDPFLGLARAITGQQRADADRSAQKRMAENDAAMTEHQARLKEQQMRLNLYDADRAKRDTARKYAAQDGAGRSLLAARGVELDSGSALDVLVDSAKRRAEDLFAVVDDAQRTNSGLAYDASALRMQAKKRRLEGTDRRSGVEKGFELFDTFSPSIGKIGSLSS